MRPESKKYLYDICHAADLLSTGRHNYAASWAGTNRAASLALV